MELIDIFYSSLRRSLVGAQGMRTSFESLKATITRAIENIKDIGGSGKLDLWRDWSRALKRTGKWHCLSQSNHAPLVKEELDRLSTQMQQTHVEATSGSSSTGTESPEG